MDVRYSQSRNSFYYACKEKKIEINFSIKIISDQKAQTIYGGSAFALLTKAKYTGYDQICN